MIEKKLNIVKAQIARQIPLQTDLGTNNRKIANLYVKKAVWDLIFDITELIFVFFLTNFVKDGKYWKRNILAIAWKVWILIKAIVKLIRKYIEDKKLDSSIKILDK